MDESWSKIYQKFPEANFLQSPLWAEANRLMGHKLVVRTFDDQAMYLGIVKDARRGRYLEIPGGPLVAYFVSVIERGHISAHGGMKCVDGDIRHR